MCVCNQFITASETKIASNGANFKKIAEAQQDVLGAQVLPMDDK